ncbi:hypothetical protein L0Y41_02480 [bacterium]|nr:hypothetical protein [bacterium]
MKKILFSFLASALALAAFEAGAHDSHADSRSSAGAVAIVPNVNVNDLQFNMQDQDEGPTEMAVPQSPLQLPGVPVIPLFSDRNTVPANLIRGNIRFALENAVSLPITRVQFDDLRANVMVADYISARLAFTPTPAYARRYPKSGTRLLLVDPPRETFFGRGEITGVLLFLTGSETDGLNLMDLWFSGITGFPFEHADRMRAERISMVCPPMEGEVVTGVAGRGSTGGASFNALGGLPFFSALLNAGKATSETESMPSAKISGYCAVIARPEPKEDANRYPLVAIGVNLQKASPIEQGGHNSGHDTHIRQQFARPDGD